MKFCISVSIIAALIIISVSCKKDPETPPEPVFDIDGNVYKTVKIGTQVWMAENLKTTRFNDGTNITQVTDSVAWRNLITPAYCLYNKNDTVYKRIYGILYNGFTIDSGKLCPTGWHVPDNEDWQLLKAFITDSLSVGGKLKESGTAHWKTPNKGANNNSGFSALPAGVRYFEGSYTAIHTFTGFWSASYSSPGDYWYLSLYYGDAKAPMNSVSKKYGLSIRCLKD
jgi:uncharacterized protein (TIGR02145 family)